jgi:hypothetical protein
MQNLCTAANMSLTRDLFLGIGGFDDAIVSGEDQDFALRHTASGGRIVFWPEATAIHCDTSLDIRSYCLRNEWGSKHMIPFCRRYPDRPDNVERYRRNGPLRFGREPFKQSLRKTVKSALAVKAVREVLFFIAGLLERVAPNGPVLERVYRLLLGAHIFRGYRAGLRLYCNSGTAQANTPDLSNSNLVRESPIKNV